MLPAFDLLASPTRLRILELTWDRERSAGDIAAGSAVTFGAVSQQLRRLREAGLVAERRAGRHRFYQARKESLGPIAAMLEQMWRSRLSTLKALAEAEEQSDDQC
jgi:DNA-binding transcriptional ArsR family regulator